MDPTVVAAWIAAGVSVLTLVGTLVAQYLGFRAASRDAEKTADDQRKQLDRTLAEQREQLDRTLDAQNQQLDRTLDEQRTRTFNERFATAAGQLGDGRPPAVRLAGVYAMAGLADDWTENRQTCVDVLCAYLRMPYEPDPGDDAPAPRRLAFQANREVRHTVIRVIAAHLKQDAGVSWHGLDFDFTDVVFDGGDFTDAQFTGGRVNFIGARFTGGRVNFNGGTVNFNRVQFTGSTVVAFYGAQFADGKVNFHDAQFSGGIVSFGGARFTGGEVSFGAARFTGSMVNFGAAQIVGGKVNFDSARFADGWVSFTLVEFAGGIVNFDRAQFVGGKVDFDDAQFVGGKVDFDKVGDWSAPPAFPWTNSPPPGVKLPLQAT